MAIQVANTSSQLTGKTIVLTDSNETISGVKTFSGAPVFNAKPVINAGLQFPATQVASGNANTLDDYEEGTFTPNITSSSGAATYSNQTGSYIKIGQLVIFTARIILSNKGTLAAGQIFFSGLPFTCEAVNWSAYVPFFGNLANPWIYFSGYVEASSTRIVITGATAGVTSIASPQVSDLSNTADFIVAGSYRASA